MRSWNKRRNDKNESILMSTLMFPQLTNQQFINFRESPIRRDQRCTVGTVEHTVRRSLEEGAVDKLLVGELG